MDLFFYREPEEAKQLEEEEAVAADHGITDYNAALGGDQWTTQIADGQWGAEAAVPPPVAAIQASEWAESGTCI